MMLQSRIITNIEVEIHQSLKAGALMTLPFSFMNRLLSLQIPE
jgi:hypothetical protein